MKRFFSIQLLACFIFSGCGGEVESVNGNYIDVRERSTTLHENELNDDYMPDGKIIKNKTGATKGTPAKIGDTVIFRGYLGEELGLSVINVKRGTNAYNIIKEKLTFIEEPPENMEYVLLEANFFSYDSKEEPYFVTALDFEIRTENEKDMKPEYLFNNENTKDDLKTGEETRGGAIFLVPKEEKDLYVVYNLEASDDSLWFSLK